MSSNCRASNMRYILQKTQKASDITAQEPKTHNAVNILRYEHKTLKHRHYIIIFTIVSTLSSLF